VVTRGGGGGGVAASGEGEGEREGEGQGPVGRLPSWAGPAAASFFIFLIFYFSHICINVLLIINCLWGYKPLYPRGPIWAAPSEVARPTR